jgi:hypothetical protein
MAREGFHKKDSEPFYAYWNPSQYGGGWLYLDENEKPGSSGYGDRDGMKYRAKHRIAVNEDGEVYAMHFDGSDLTPKSRPDVTGHFESALMAMYVGRAKLNVDIDDDDVRHAASGYLND